MYKVYVDKNLFSKDKAWKNIANNERFEVVSYSNFEDLVLKLNLEIFYKFLYNIPLYFLK